MADTSSQPSSSATPTPAPVPVVMGPKDLSTATWRPISTVNAPTDNNCPSAVWTGSKMLVVSGVHGASANFSVNTGGATQVWSYDPKTDVWATLPTASRPPGRVSHTSVWSGNRLINFGGHQLSSGCQSTGCWYYEVYVFDPANSTWTQMANAPIVAGRYVARYGHASVMAGTLMVTYSGVSPFEMFNVAAAFNLATNAWSVPPAGPDARSFLSGAMYNNRAYFWGGANTINYAGADAQGFSDGVIFDTATQTWGRWTQSAPLLPRAAAAMASSSNQIIVWGGRLGATSFNDGAVFEPSNNSWKALPMANAPSARECAASVWTGEEFIVWGGKVNGVPSQSGGILK